MAQHIIWHDHAVSKAQRNKLKSQQGAVIWLTGLSGSGKSTIANAVDHALYNNQYHSFVLDGDNIRHGLNKDLGFSDADRQENIRRIGEVAKLFVESGQIVLTAFISPFKNDRELVRKMFADKEFIEVYVKCPIEKCEQRDPKGLYVKARQGIIPEFTGISSPYEAPDAADITLETNHLSIDQAVNEIIVHLRNEELIV